ncbi:MAG: hypothetical protein QM724_08155 [Flavobacteriales bacterium]
MKHRITLAIVLLPSIIHAQTTVHIEVRDMLDNAPIPQAIVSDGSNPRASMGTDPMGHAELTLSGASMVRMKAAHPAYQPCRIDIHLSGGTDLDTLRFYLVPVGFKGGLR